MSYLLVKDEDHIFSLRLRKMKWKILGLADLKEILNNEDPFHSDKKEFYPRLTFLSSRSLFYPSWTFSSLRILHLPLFFAWITLNRDLLSKRISQAFRHFLIVILFFCIF